MSTVLLPNHSHRANTCTSGTILPATRAGRKIMASRVLQPFIGFFTEACTPHAFVLETVAAAMDIEHARGPNRCRKTVVFGAGVVVGVPIAILFLFVRSVGHN